MSDFGPEIVGAVVAHMNGDHPEDNLLIVHAFGRPAATAARMTGLDAHGGDWEVTDPAGTGPLRVAWPAAPITERAEIRREVVALYESACERLGQAPRPH